MSVFAPPIGPALTYRERVALQLQATVDSWHERTPRTKLALGVLLVFISYAFFRGGYVLAADYPLWPVSVLVLWPVGLACLGHLMLCLFPNRVTGVFAWLTEMLLWSAPVSFGILILFAVVRAVVLLLTAG